MTSRARESEQPKTGYETTHEERTRPVLANCPTYFLFSFWSLPDTLVPTTFSLLFFFIPLCHLWLDIFCVKSGWSSSSHFLLFNSLLYPSFLFLDYRFLIVFSLRLSLFSISLGFSHTFLCRQYLLCSSMFICSTERILLVLPSTQNTKLL